MHHTVDDETGLAVVGSDEDRPDERDENGPGGWRAHRLRGLLRVRSLATAPAALGAVAVFISLVEEWQVTTLLMYGTLEEHEFAAKLGVLDGWSPAYLVGVLAVTACLALVLFGPRPGREHLRVAGLATSGVLLAMLVAIALDLQENSAALTNAGWYAPDLEAELAYGRGVVAAFVGVAGYALALLLAGRRPPAEEPGGDDLAEDDDVTADEPDQRWPRPRQAGHGPLDLTVEPAKPFVP